MSPEVVEELKRLTLHRAIRDGADQAVGNQKLSRQRTQQIVDLLVDYLFQGDISRLDLDIVWVGHQLADVQSAARQIFDTVIPEVARAKGFVIDQGRSRQLRTVLGDA